METLSEMGIRGIYGTTKNKITTVKAIELKDAWLFKKQIVEVIPKGDD